MKPLDEANERTLPTVTRHWFSRVQVDANLSDETS